MNKCYIPTGYQNPLTVYETQRAIEFIKRNFQSNLCHALNLKRVSAPLFVEESSGLNDNLNGYERPVSFDVPAVGAETTPYQDGDVVKLGKMDIEVLHTPGHTPGGVTLKVGDVLLTGDTLFQGSMGRTDFEGGSYAEIMASLGRLGRLSGDYHVLPGHMGASTLEQERKTNYYLREAMEG